MKIISKGKPASQIKPVRMNSKKSLNLLATLKGASIDDLMKVTSWPRSAASSAIATDIVPLGYKVTLDDGVYIVVFPKARAVQSRCSSIIATGNSHLETAFNSLSAISMDPSSYF